MKCVILQPSYIPWRGSFLGRPHLNVDRDSQYHVRQVLAESAGLPRRSEARGPGRGVPESLAP